MSRTARNEALRRRIERGIAVASPLLDLTLVVAERSSRVFGTGEPDQLPVSVRRDGGQAAARVRTRAGHLGPDV